MGRVEPKSQRYIATKEGGPLRDTEVLQKKGSRGWSTESPLAARHSGDGNWKGS